MAGKTVTAIAAGGFHSLALTSDGTVTGWGNDRYGDTEVPASLTGKTVTAIAAGSDVSMALTSDGHVTEWGDERAGPVPASLAGKTVTAIATSVLQSLALTSDGRIAEWDSVYDSELDPPASLDDQAVTAIAAGNNYDLAIVGPLLHVTSVSPVGGPATGGQTVTITGSGFTGANGVSFGSGHPAASFHIDSDTRITAVTPARSQGQDNVVVTGPDASSPRVLGDLYTFHGGRRAGSPTITGISPASGLTTGGKPVTISGNRFTGAVRVTFGEETVPFTATSDHRISVQPPAHVRGRVDVSVVTTLGASRIEAADHYTYSPRPVVSSVSPAYGPSEGGSTVVIRGSGFTGATAVYFAGGRPATSFTVAGDGHITAVSPAHSPAVVNVFVATRGGGTSAAAAADHYRYLRGSAARSNRPASSRGQSS